MSWNRGGADGRWGRPSPEAHREEWDFRLPRRTDDTTARTRLSARLAVAVAAAAVAALAVGVGEPRLLVGLAGALAFGWGTAVVDDASNARRAAGSVGVVVGGLAVVGVVVWNVRPLAPVAGVVGVAVLAVGATGGTARERFRPLWATLRDSGVFLGVAALATVFLELVAAAAAGADPPAPARLLSVAPLTAVFLLQVCALAVVGLFGRARETVQRWVRGSATVPETPLDRLSLDDVPPAYWVVLVVQLLLVWSPWLRAVADWLLSSMGPFGGAVSLLLTSGALLAPLALTVALLAAVLVAEGLRNAVVAAAGPVPVRTAARSTGGVVAIAIAAVGALAGLGEQFLALLGDRSLAEFGPVGVFRVAVWALALGVAAVAVVTFLGARALDLGRTRATDVVVGSSLVFVAAVGADGAGAPPLAVFGGVTAALAAWDLGTTAADLGTHVGPDAESRRAEVVHAAGTLGVGALGVALAAATVHVLGPIGVPGERAAAAAVLAVIGLLALAAALVLGEEG